MRTPMLWAAFLAAGCLADPPNECPSVGRRCDGNVAETCSFQWDTEISGHRALQREECGGRFCQVPPAGQSGGAFCSLDPSVDPRSPPELRASAQAKRCVDGVLTAWSFGLRVEAAPCPGALACVDVTTPGFDPACSDVAFCSSKAEPEPLCTPETFTTCEGDRTIVYCSCGFRRDAHFCSSPGPRCVFTDVNGAGLIQGVCRP